MGIVVNNLTKKYGIQKAVDNISFELKNGEITGFIGPNGSGKSTTMKSICGIVIPDMGNILINGINSRENDIRIKRNIGYLPENNPLYNDQYVEEYLKFVAGFYPIKNKKAKIKEIIELTGLSPEKKKKIGQLSKGYKQRIGLAQALIHDPDILILDEPTTGLDPIQLAEIRNLIQNIAKNKTVMLSTHILQEVEAICHRVLMINKGKIVAHETTSKVMEGTSKKQSVMVEFKEDVSEELIQKIIGLEHFKKSTDKTWLLEGDLKSDLRESIFNFAMQNKLNILELKTLRKSLEETFKELSSDK